MKISGLIKNISESEKSPIVIKLLEIIQQQSEENQLLKDEIARLKGQKSKPKIKSSNLDKKTDKKNQTRKSLVKKEVQNQKPSYS